MADSFVRVAPDDLGKRLQTFQNTIGGVAVEAEAVTLVDSTGAVIATLPVSLASVPSHAVTNAGTFAVQVTSAPTTAVTIAATVVTKETRSTTPAQSSVANSITNVTLLAFNANRLGATIYNDDTAAVLKVKLGATASSTSFTIAMAPGGYYEVPFSYTGIIDGIASAATGSARITELT